MTAVLSEPLLERQLSVRGKAQPGFPVEPGATVELEGRTVLWLGPDEWLVLGAREADFPDAAAVVDVSANRVVFELSGDGSDAVLAQGCSLDLHPSVFGPRRSAQTLLARVEVILYRLEAGSWWILVRPSFAPFLRAWLADAIEGAATSRRSSR